MMISEQSRLTEPPASGLRETDATVCIREMEAHVTKSLRCGYSDPAAQVHATLALAWATRLGATRA